jgi:hypothetical protein
LWSRPCRIAPLGTGRQRRCVGAGVGSNRSRSRRRSSSSTCCLPAMACAGEVGQPRRCTPWAPVVAAAADCGQVSNVACEMAACALFLRRQCGALRCREYAVRSTFKCYSNNYLVFRRRATHPPSRHLLITDPAAVHQSELEPVECVDSLSRRLIIHPKHHCCYRRHSGCRTPAHRPHMLRQAGAHQVRSLDII